jgi:alpha-tubulin suppressor-like RCC1 family protein
MVDSSGNSITAFKDVITGFDGTLFLTEDGRVFEAGSLVTTNYIPTQKIFPVGTIINKIFAPSGRYASGSVSFFALSTTGQLYSWGNNTWGQLGIGNTTNQTIPQLVQGDITGKVITDVSVSGNNGMHIACIDNTGQLYTWGYNDGAYGGNALGIAGLSGSRTTPFAVPLMTNIVKVVAAGLFHNVTGEVNMTRVIKADGTSWASGRGTAGALANGSTADSSVFIQENQGYADIVDIFASNCYPAVPQAIIRSNGFVYFAGRRINQAFGDGLADGDLTSFTNTAQLNSAGFQGKMIANGNGIIPKVRIGGDADGNTFTVVLDNTGTLWACGKNNVGQCGVGLNADPITVFSKCTIPTNVPVVDFRTSGSSNDGAGIIALLQDGSMFSCGYNNYGSLGNLHTTSGSQNIFFRPLIGFEPNSKN